MREERVILANITLSGRVQGVGFRYFVSEVAGNMGLDGEVWNNYDGTVEINVYCPHREDLDTFIAKIKEGPPLSSVSDINIEVRSSDPPIQTGFDIRMR